MTLDERRARAKEVMAKWPKPTKEDCRIVTRLNIEHRARQRITTMPVAA